MMMCYRTLTTLDDSAIQMQMTTAGLSFFTSCGSREGEGGKGNGREKDEGEASSVYEPSKSSK